jgi:hypothetical protein
MSSLSAGLIAIAGITAFYYFVVAFKDPVIQEASEETKRQFRRQTASILRAKRKSIEKKELQSVNKSVELSLEDYLLDQH